MNELKSVNYSGPFGEEHVTCAMLIIDNVYSPFVLHNISEVNKEYTFSLYIRSDTEGSITVGGETIKTTTEWTNHAVTFIADSIDVSIFFDVIGTYYLYNTQLEIGNRNTDWRPAVEDVEQSISDTRTYFDITSESIRGEVVATESRMSSLIEQTASGIRSEVSGIEGRVTTIEQTASGITARLNGVESTANNASKTATNYLNFGQNGLCIGDHTASSLGRNILIGSEYIDFRNNGTTLARYGADKIELGLSNNIGSSISFCGDELIFGYSTQYQSWSLKTKSSLWMEVPGTFEAMSFEKNGSYQSSGGIHCDISSDGVPRTVLASSKIVNSPYSLIESRITVGADYITMYADGSNLVQFNLISGSNTIEATAGSFKVSGSIYEGGTALSGKYVGLAQVGDYPRMTLPNSHQWLRMSSDGGGILPYQQTSATGSSYIGASGWPFKYINAIQHMAESTSNAEVGFYAYNSLHKGAFISSSGGSLGIYSNTHGRWAFEMKSGGLMSVNNIIEIRNASSGSVLRPLTDNVGSCGGTSYRWTEVCAMKGTISTSDEREKDILTDMDLKDFSDLFMSIDPIVYRWKYGVDDKIHFGVGAQTLKRQFEEHGYDPMLYGVIEYDELEKPTPTGQTDRYSMNYQNLQMLTLMQTQKNTRELEELKKLKEINTNLQAQVENLRDIVMQMYHEFYVLKNTTH